MIVEPGRDAEREIIAALIEAAPGTVIQLEAGRYDMTTELLAATDHLTLRGRGPEATVLSFEGQRSGASGIELSGDALVVEDLAVVETAGNAIKVLGATGVVLRRLRVEWSREPESSHGAYGLYPVGCREVLVEDCVVRGASDAGIYVGQSHDVIVRGSRAERNVAGIEIENCLRADVYDNVATDNAGGVLVFDLPGLDPPNGGGVRIFRNRVLANNHTNFAPAGNIVGSVSSGTGVMVLAAADVEIFANEIVDHRSVSVGVYSYFVTERPVNDEDFRPWAERVHVHDNTIVGGGEDPQGAHARFVPALGLPLPAILWDGMIDPERGPDAPPGVVLARNGDARFADLGLGTTRSPRLGLAEVSGELPPLPEVALPPLPEPPRDRPDPAAVYRRVPRRLSEFGLFAGDIAGQEPARGVLPYDINTALFSDGTLKDRFIRLPPGGRMAYAEEDAFGFPVGTVIVKTFSESVARRIETRILSLEPEGWYGYTYVWNEEQSDAVLALGGGTTRLGWTDPSGVERETEYEIPNARQCGSCHVTDIDSAGLAPIGPKARHLSLPVSEEGVSGRDPGDPGAASQLERWSRSGHLAGLPEGHVVPRAARVDDPASGTVEARARAWLDINCAHCHSRTGAARTSGLDLRITETDPERLGIWKTPIAAGRGSGGRRFGIVPGDPDRSILVHRIESTELTVMMPPLGRSRVDEVGVSVVREWIASLPAETPDSEARRSE